jgi:hypothetical protein
VYHICCIPDGPANAREPTMSGNHVAVNQSESKNPNENVPVTVDETSPQLPTIEAMIADPITRIEMNVVRTFSTTL